MAKVKMNIQFEEELKNYIEEQSERLGVSQSGFINLCVAQYKEHQQSVAAMSNMAELIAKIDQLQQDLEKKSEK